MRPIFLCHIRLDNIESKRLWGVSEHRLMAVQSSRSMIFCVRLEVEAKVIALQARAA